MLCWSLRGTILGWVWVRFAWRRGLTGGSRQLQPPSSLYLSSFFPLLSFLSWGFFPHGLDLSYGSQFRLSPITRSSRNDQNGWLLPEVKKLPLLFQLLSFHFDLSTRVVAGVGSGTSPPTRVSSSRSWSEWARSWVLRPRTWGCDGMKWER